ncbi:MAG: tyrosine--tRNA ligase [Chitinophagales bacterium]
MNFIEELRWRGMLHNSTPGVEKLLENEKPVAAYLGCDPTAPSLTIGNLASLMMLIHFQKAGHKPIALVGGATGMIGDPSGKSAERELKSVEVLHYNVAQQKKILQKLLDFDHPVNGAELVNNHDWFKDMPVLDFLRDIGKNLTVNYMMAKDSVKNRLESGISFTEFSYQLIQGYDFVYLNKHKNCKIQFGGSDQWGNMTAGTELIRKMSAEGEETEAYAVTCPLITKADGTKFGKTESGAVWLSPELTSPYKFYQFWLNSSDEDVKRYIRIFTLLDKETIEALEAEHNEAPHQRILQKRLAQEITTMLHGEDAYDTAIQASEILFGKGTKQTLRNLSEDDFLDIFRGVPQIEISQSAIKEGINVVDFLAEATQLFSSKGEIRRGIKGNGISINKEKVSDADSIITTDDLIAGKYILMQKGKKSYAIGVVS